MKYLLFVFLFTYIQCGTYIKVPVVEKSPPGFQEFMGSGRNLGIYVYKNETVSFSDTNNWKEVIHGSVLNAFQNYRYFKIIDVSSREARLKEIAYSQKIGNLKDLSRELSIEGLLFIDVPRPPNHECRSNTFTENKQVCVASDSAGKCLRYQTRTEVNFVKELTYTVFANARLVNLETAQSMQFTNSTPAVLKNTSQFPVLDCPSLLQGFKKAVEIAAYNIADHLSPKMSDMSVPIYDSVDGITDKSSKNEVKNLLNSGKKWIDTDSPNLEMAKKNWEKALSLSGGSSASAYWNLGVYHWSKGNLDTADYNFQKSLEVGGPDWIDSKKRDIISKFQAEKEREKLRRRE